MPTSTIPQLAESTEPQDTFVLPADDGAQTFKVSFSTLKTFFATIFNPTTTRGDLIRRGATVLERFSAVTDNRVVRGNGTDVVLGQIDNPDFFTTGSAAGASSIGIVTTGSQTFAGEKTFSTGIKLPTSGGTATAFDFYQDATGSTNTSGTVQTRSVSWKVSRAGKLVTLSIASIVDTDKDSNTGNINLNSLLPTWARPSATLVFIQQGKINTTTAAIAFAIATDGTVIMTGNAAGGTIAANTINCRWVNTLSFSWVI